MSTACIMVIGNEILSGRTRDENIGWLALELNKVGIRVMEARVVLDIPKDIIKAVNECRAQYDYVFTTGGIGPTHDDITSECIAQAFGVKYVRHPEALSLMNKHYPAENLNEARLKMTDMPEGATLIPNPVSVAPGFIIGNVYVMAGIPRVMQAMFDHIKHTLQGGRPMVSVTVSVFLTEGTIAKGLTEIQNSFPDVEIGSYPFVRSGRLGTSLVSRHTDPARAMAARDAIVVLLNSFKGEIAPGEDA